MVKYKDSALPLCKDCICSFASKDISIPLNMAANKNKAKINCMIFIICLNLKTLEVKADQHDFPFTSYQVFKAN